MPEYLGDLNTQLEGRSVTRILKLAFDQFGDDISMTSAFGASGMVLLHHILPLRPQIKVHFIDTGYHFPETLEFAEKLRTEWDLNLQILKPEKSDSHLGLKPYETDADACCGINKVEPLTSFIYQQSAWISAIRRDQSITRSKLNTVEIDQRGIIKVSPMINWTSRDVWTYINDHDVPIHPLYDKGYPSIGCAPCTARVGEDGSERDGRWINSSKLECGIHAHSGFDP